MNKKSPLLSKRRMQDVSFSSSGDFLDFLPADKLKMVEKLPELEKDEYR